MPFPPQLNTNPYEVLVFGLVLAGLGWQLTLFFSALDDWRDFRRELWNCVRPDDCDRCDFLEDVMVLARSHALDAATHVAIKLILVGLAGSLLFLPPPVVPVIRLWVAMAALGVIAILLLLNLNGFRAFRRRTTFVRQRGHLAYAHSDAGGPRSRYSQYPAQADEDGHSRALFWRPPMTLPLSPQLQAALERALVVALPAGALAGLGSLQQGASWKTVLIVGLVAFFSALLIRGAGEGLYDRYRALHGLAKPSDVGQQPKPLL